MTASVRTRLRAGISTSPGPRRGRSSSSWGVEVLRGRFRRLLLHVAAALVVAGLLAPAASADRRWVKDGDDTRGFLDMEAVAHRHGAAPSILQHRVRTFARWKSRRLECGSLGLAFHGLNRALRVFYDDGLKAEMVVARNGSVLAPVRVWRPSARTVAVSFPKRLLRRGLARYAWSAHTATWGRGACPPFEGDPGEDIDRVSNRGGIVHNLERRRLTGRN